MDKLYIYKIVGGDRRIERETDHQSEKSINCVSEKALYIYNERRKTKGEKSARQGGVVRVV